MPANKKLTKDEQREVLQYSRSLAKQSGVFRASTMMTNMRKFRNPSVRYRCSSMSSSLQTPEKLVSHLGAATPARRNPGLRTSAMKGSRRFCAFWHFWRDGLMLGKIYRYLADDHRRLDALLERVMSDPEEYRRRGLCPISLGFAQAHRRGVEGFSFPRHKGYAAANRFPSRPDCASITATWLRCWSHRRRRRWLRRFARFSRFITRSKKSPAVCTITANSWRKPRGRLDIGVVVR